MNCRNGAGFVLVYLHDHDHAADREIIPTVARVVIGRDWIREVMKSGTMR
jgi:hypothetical protein